MATIFRPPIIQQRTRRKPEENKEVRDSLALTNAPSASPFNPIDTQFNMRRFRSVPADSVALNLAIITATPSTKPFFLADTGSPYWYARRRRYYDDIPNVSPTVLATVFHPAIPDSAGMLQRTRRLIDFPAPNLLLTSLAAPVASPFTMVDFAVQEKPRRPAPIVDPPNLLLNALAPAAAQPFFPFETPEARLQVKRLIIPTDSGINLPVASLPIVFPQVHQEFENARRSRKAPRDLKELTVNFVTQVVTYNPDIELDLNISRSVLLNLSINRTITDEGKLTQR